MVVASSIPQISPRSFLIQMFSDVKLAVTVGFSPCFLKCCVPTSTTTDPDCETGKTAFSIMFIHFPIFFILGFLNLICSGLKQCPSWGAQVTELSANGRAQLSQLCKTGGGPLGAGLWFSPVKCW